MDLQEIMLKLSRIESKMDEIQDKIDTCCDLCGQSVDEIITMDAQYSQLLHDITKGPGDTVIVFTAQKGG